MTSANFLGFWTPYPLVSTKSTQPPFLMPEIGQPPPSPSLLTSFVKGPLLKYKNPYYVRVIYFQLLCRSIDGAALGRLE